MERSSVKLAFLLLILANASVIGPLTAEARCKEHKKPHKPKHAPSPSPTPLSPPPTPEPAPLSSPPTPETGQSPPEPEVMAPYIHPHGCGIPCSASNPCSTWKCPICCANGTCCYQTYPIILPPSPSRSPVQAPSPPPILADEPVSVPSDLSPSQSPVDVQVPSPPPVLADEPASVPSDLSPSPVDVQAPAYVPPTFPPYQIHGCGHKCADSNDCDWPCTECCYHSPNNYTCC